MCFNARAVFLFQGITAPCALINTLQQPRTFKYGSCFRVKCPEGEVLRLAANNHNKHS